MKEYVFPDYLTGDDIKRIRARLHMTQKEFASLTNTAVRTVERWESSKEKIKGPIVPLADILFRDYELPERMRVPKNRRKYRLCYMYHQMVCTIIDVDDLEQKVDIYNYVINPIFRAFGVNTEPTYEDYLAFLESRCFPRSRDKIKLELKSLGVPFYDPFMIIEKTQGRMAEDDQWMEVQEII